MWLMMMAVAFVAGYMVGGRRAERKRAVATRPRLQFDERLMREGRRWLGEEAVQRQREARSSERSLETSD